MDENQVEFADSLAMLDVAMLVAEELSTDGLTLAQIWSRITQWIEQGLYPGSKEKSRVSERRQLTLLDEGGIRRVEESYPASVHFGEGEHRK